MKTWIGLALMVALSSASVAQADGNVKYRCGGTEPFWGMAIGPDYVTLTMIGIGPNGTDGLIFSKNEVQPAAGYPEEWASQIVAERTTGKGLFTKKDKALISLVNGGESGCNDGASDEHYSHHALVNVKGMLLYGCCNAQ